MKNNLWWITTVISIVFSLMNPFVRFFGISNMLIIFPVLLTFSIMKLAKWAVGNAGNGGFMIHYFTYGGRSLDKEVNYVKERNKMLSGEKYVNMLTVLLCFVIVILFGNQALLIYGPTNIWGATDTDLETGQLYFILSSVFMFLSALFSTIKLRSLIEKN